MTQILIEIWIKKSIEFRERFRKARAELEGWAVLNSI